MANAVEYTPDEQIQELVQRHVSGGQLTQAELNLLNQLYSQNPGFKKFYNRMRAAMRGVGGASARRTGGQTKYQNGTGGGMSLPGLNQNLQARSSGYGSRVTSPGGFKKSGQDQDSDIRRDGHRTPQSVLREVKPVVDRSKNPTGGYSFNGKTYGKSQVDWIVRRGLSGATLSPDQQAIYDRYVAEQDAIENAAADKKAQGEMARQKREEAEAKELDWKRKLEMQQERIRLQGENQMKAMQERQRLAGEAKARDAARKEAEKQAWRDALNKKHNLDEGTVLDDKDYYALEKGLKKYGYSRENQKKFDALQAELADIEDDYELSEEDKAIARSEYEKKINSIPKMVVDVPYEDRDTKSILAEANDNNGYYRDKDGKLVRIDDSARVREENERRRQAEREEARADRRATWIANNLLKERNAHQSRRDKALKDFNDDKIGNRGKTFEYPEFDENATLERLANTHDRLFKTSAPTAETPVEEPVDDGTDEFVDDGFGFCPNDGTPLNENFECPECGYPNENVEEDAPWTSGYGAVQTA